MKNTIKIEGKTYPIRFGYGAFRILGEKWNCKGIQGVAKKFQDIFPEQDTEDLEFDQAKMLGDLALAGMENAGGEDLPHGDEVVQSIVFEDSSQLSTLMNAFSDSFPQSGNPKPVKKTGKKKK